MNDTIKITTIINNSVECVWKTLINPVLWWKDTKLDAVVGGTFEERWNGNSTSGVVLELEENYKLTFSWKDEDWKYETRVTFLLTKATNNSTNITLSHTGWEQFSEKEREKLIQNHTIGWHRHLDNLKATAEHSM